MPIIVNSKFNNLTYDEITQPLEKVTKAHNEVMEQYMQDASSVDMLANTLNPELDKEALAILQEHQAKNENAVNELMAKGLTPNTRALVLDLQKDANTRVSGVAMASATRQEIGKQQSQLLLQHPDLMFRHKANELSLDTIMANPNENYNEAIDLNKVSEEAAKLVTAMSQNDVKLYLEQGKYKNALPAIVEKLGWSYDEIQKKLNDPNNRNNAMNVALDEIRKQTGVDNWGDANAIANVQYAIKRGAEWAVGKTQKQLYQPKEKNGNGIDDEVEALNNAGLLKPVYDAEGNAMSNTLQSAFGTIYHKIGGMWTRDGDDTAKRALEAKQFFSKFENDPELKKFYERGTNSLYFRGDVKGLFIPPEKKPDMTYEFSDTDKHLYEGGYEKIKNDITQRIKKEGWSAINKISVPASQFKALLDALNTENGLNDIAGSEPDEIENMLSEIKTFFNDDLRMGANMDNYIITFLNGKGPNNAFQIQSKWDYKQSVTDYSSPIEQMSGNYQQ